MYVEFQKVALEDAWTANYNYGIECVFRFYRSRVESNFVIKSDYLFCNFAFDSYELEMKF